MSATLLVLALLIRPSPLAPQEAFSREEFRAALLPEIQRVLDRGAASVSIAAVEGGTIAWSGAFGHANHATEAQATARTLYDVGSTFKPVTATAILQLVERGHIELDEPVAGYLQDLELPWADHGVTFRHLLTHTSGLAPSDGTVEVWSRASSATLEEVAQRLRAHHPPGEIYEYNNAGYAVLGLLLERITGRDFQEYVVEEVLRPLGVETPAPVRPTPQMLERMAFPYEASADGKPLPVAPIRYDVYPAGDVYLTAEDMARFLGAHVGGGAFGGARLLSVDSVESMRRPHLEDYGLGWGLLPEEDGPLIGHGGHVRGFTAQMLGDPQRGVGVFVVSNSGDVLRLARAALTILQGKVYQSPEERPVARVDPDRLARLAGVYEIGPGLVLRVSPTAGGLRLVAPDGRELDLLPASERVFFDRDVGLQVEFRERGEALVLEIREGGSAERIVGPEDRADWLLGELQDRAVSGLSDEDARRFVARARFLTPTGEQERALALTSILLACELSESGLAVEWAGAARELVAMEGQLERLFARFGFLPSALIDLAQRLVAEVEVERTDPEALAACDIARMDLLLARLRSGSSWSEAELASARRRIGEVAERHALRTHPFGLDLGSYCERALHELEHLRPGLEAPELQGPDLAGAERNLAEFEGQVVLLVFWASWCPPCVASLPEENELLQEYGERGLAVVGVNGDPDRDEARAFAAAHGVEWPSFWNGPGGAAGPMALSWNVLSWPTAYLLDHKGRIRKAFPAGMRGRARTAIEALLAERKTGE